MENQKKTKEFIKTGKRVVEREARALDLLEKSIEESFSKAVKLILASKGRVIVSGMGKSGHIARKISATLASTGTPSHFLHPGEASHGDLGMITSDDVVLTISNSGETAEVLAIVPVIRRIGAKLIGMSGNTHSTLAQLSDVHICIQVSQEACPLGLAPTSSTTATLVMGDALAVALLSAKGFTADDFALSHPGGSLGKRLLLRLSDIMHGGENLPQISNTSLIKDALVEMSAKGLGMTTIVDEQGILVGLFTDGDLRRVLANKADIHQDTITSVMTVNPSVATADMLAAEALKIMEDKHINGLIIVDENKRPVGAMNMQDLLRSGVI